MNDDPRIRQFAQGVLSPEGPVSLPDGRWIVTEMQRGTVTLIGADGGSERIIAHTGRPNGLATDAARNIWVAESLSPALLRLSMDGRTVTVSSGTTDHPFLWPNDLCFGPDGALYLTDSGLLVSELGSAAQPRGYLELDYDGRIWRVDPDTGSVDSLDEGLRFANGIAFSSSGELFVAETVSGNIYRYGEVGGPFERSLFTNVLAKPATEYGGFAGPDGMAFDEAGRLHVCVLTQGDITVVNGDGSISHRVPLPGSFPTNVAFAADGSEAAIVTEGSGNQLLWYEAGAGGADLLRPPIGELP